VATLWLVNGRSTGVDPADRGLAYGDGLFETMAAVEGNVRRLDAHFERLAEGCARLDIPPLDWAALRQEILAQCPRRGRAVVKLILTRGAGTRGYRPPKDPKPTRIVGISEWPDYPAANYSAGIELRTLQTRLGENPRLAGIKHLNRLEQVVAQLELQSVGAQEGLLLDTGGRVVGGISSNVFAVQGRELVTPAITRCGVRGVMRRTVLEAAVDVGLDPVERDVLPAELGTANEVFVTNALFEIWPVARLDDHRLTLGANTRALMARLGIVECVSASG
jgi:4-amino-4-deoxychorismate lyase